MGPFRSLWKATVSFGLVSIPVKVYAASEDKDIHLRQLHQKCGSPIQYRKWCPVCNEEVPPEAVVSGYPIASGRFVPLSEDELAELPLPEARMVQILDFADLAGVDPVYFDRAYYLEPLEGAGRAYRLLVEAMAATGRAGIARLAMRRRETLAALRPIDNVLAMHTMHWHDEVRAPAEVVEVPAGARVDARERQMAVQLIEQLTAPFEPARYPNQRRQAFAELIERKAAGEPPVVAPQPGPAPVMDLVAALQASLQQAGDGKAAADGKHGPRRASRR